MLNLLNNVSVGGNNKENVRDKERFLFIERAKMWCFTYLPRLALAHPTTS